MHVRSVSPVPIFMGLLGDVQSADVDITGHKLFVAPVVLLLDWIGLVI